VWAYFDYVVLAAERRLASAQGHERARLARDSYSYLHLLMVASIVFIAPGIKRTLAHVGDPLEVAPAVALCGSARRRYAPICSFEVPSVRQGQKCQKGVRGAFGTFGTLLI
jgi:low temperature requirement protein LtrA